MRSFVCSSTYVVPIYAAIVFPHAEMFSFILRILRSVFQDAISYVYPKPSIVSVNSRNVSSVGRNQYNTTITNSDTIEIAKHILAPASTSTLDNHLDAAYEAQCVILKKIRRQVPQVELQLECGVCNLNPYFLVTDEHP